MAYQVEPHISVVIMKRLARAVAVMQISL